MALTAGMLLDTLKEPNCAFYGARDAEIYEALPFKAEETQEEGVFYVAKTDAPLPELSSACIAQV